MVVFRPALATDRVFIQHMLVAAADWQPDSAPRPVEQMLSDPALNHYVSGWPRATDFGVIAEDSAREPLGAVWSRYFSVENPGYGFIAPDIPELAIGVIPKARGTGVGRGLMVQLIDEARNRRIDRLSLSAELDNFARHLYISLGFSAVAQVDGSVTMVIDLT